MLSVCLSQGTAGWSFWGGCKQLHVWCVCVKGDGVGTRHPGLCVWRLAQAGVSDCLCLGHVHAHRHIDSGIQCKLRASVCEGSGFSHRPLTLVKPLEADQAAVRYRQLRGTDSQIQAANVSVCGQGTAVIGGSPPYMPPFAACPLVAPACPVGSCFAVAGALRVHTHGAALLAVCGLWLGTAGSVSQFSQLLSQPVSQECYMWFLGGVFAGLLKRGHDKLVSQSPQVLGRIRGGLLSNPTQRGGMGDIWACFF